MWEKLEGEEASPAAAASGEGSPKLSPEEARQPAGVAEARPDEAPDAAAGLLAAQGVAPEEGPAAIHVLPLLLPQARAVRPQQRRRRASGAIPYSSLRRHLLPSL